MFNDVFFATSYTDDFDDVILFGEIFKIQNFMWIGIIVVWHIGSFLMMRD